MAGFCGILVGNKQMIRLGGVLQVPLLLLQVTHINVPDNDGVAIRVQEVLALRITAQNDWLTALCSRQSGVNELCFCLIWGKM